MRAYTGVERSGREASTAARENEDELDLGHGGRWYGRVHRARIEGKNGDLGEELTEEGWSRRTSSRPMERT